jgi:hypothetical protein
MQGERGGRVLTVSRLLLLCRHMHLNKSARSLRFPPVAFNYSLELSAQSPAE